MLYDMCRIKKQTGIVFFLRKMVTHAVSVHKLVRPHWINLILNDYSVLSIIMLITLITLVKFNIKCLHCIKYIYD